MSNMHSKLVARKVKANGMYDDAWRDLGLFTYTDLQGCASCGVV